jgi:hypothetical protein
VILAHVAVPVASALESSVNAENVSTPFDTVPHGSEQVTVPSRLVAAPFVAGLVPS